MDKIVSNLLYGASNTNADLLYLGRFWAPDNFFAFTVGNRSIAVVNSLEYTRCKEESCFDEVLCLDDELKSSSNQKSCETTGNQLSANQKLFISLKERYKIDAFEVCPDTFPVGLFRELAKVVKISVAEASPFKKARTIKSDFEIREIEKANAVAAEGMGRAKEILQESDIVEGKLFWREKALTSEILRNEIELRCFSLGGIAQNTIVASGPQAAEPHCLGSGPISANELIVIDIFPRLISSGYHGDMSRTFLKGKATERQKMMVQAVALAQKEAMSAVKSNVQAKKVHNAAAESLIQSGFTNKQNDGFREGFVHSIGHGVGLDLHEAPSFGKDSEILSNGTVVTVEPGLYYKDVGGVRIEDCIRVTEEGFEMLSSFPYDWIID